MKRNAVHYIRK